MNLSAGQSMRIDDQYDALLMLISPVHTKLSYTRGEHARTRTHHLRSQFTAQQHVHQGPEPRTQPASTDAPLDSPALEAAFDRALGRKREHTASGLDGMALASLSTLPHHLLFAMRNQELHLLQARL